MQHSNLIIVMYAKDNNYKPTIGTDTEVGGSQIQNLLPCREDFFREEGSNDCIPSCHTWQEFSQTEVIVTDVIMVGANVIGLVAGIIIIAFSIIRRQKMLVSFKKVHQVLSLLCRWTFPSFFVVILTVNLVILGAFLFHSAMKIHSFN